MGIEQEAQNKLPLSPFPAMRPPPARRPVVRTAPQKTCLTARLRRNVMAQNIGGARMPTQAARQGKASPMAPATQAREKGLGKNPFFPRLRGESDGYRLGHVNFWYRTGQIYSSFYSIICPLFIHSPIFIEFLIYSRHCAFVELNRCNAFLHGYTIIDWTLQIKLILA